MKVYLRLGLFSIFTAFTFSVFAQDAPYATRPLSPVNITRGSALATIDLTGLFALENVAGPLFEFDLNVGTFYAELYPDVAPRTVANFQKYLTDGKYNGTFLHRSVPGFVVQGGGYSYLSTSYPHIEVNQPVVNEFKLPNVNGTLAMAKFDGDLNSATSEWFFNTADNSGPNGLDGPTQKFTVFGRLIGTGLDFVTLINQQKTLDLNSDPTGPFGEVPVVSTVSGDNLITLETLSEVPMLKLPATARGYLTVSATSSDDTLVKPEITAQGLRLTAGTRTGPATISVVGYDQLGDYATVSFVANSVDPALPVVSITAGRGSSSESGGTGLIRLSRSGSLARPLIVHLHTSGTANYASDVYAFSTSTIPAGRSALNIPIRPRNDSLREGIEDLTVSLVDQPSYTVAPIRSASVSIIDNDVPNLTMKVLTASTQENVPGAAVVRLTRTGPVNRPMAVPFALSGTANANTDIISTHSPAIIPAGKYSTTISISAVADTIKEPTESVVITPSRSVNYNILTKQVVVSVLDTL